MENFTVYVAPHFFEHELKNEIEFLKLPLVEQKGRLFLVKDKPKKLCFAQNTWLEPFFMPFKSIGETAKALKAIQRNWHCHPTDYFRRSNLIKEKLPPIKFKPQIFGEAVPKSPMGSFTLWNDNILASAKCSSAFADGECMFLENKLEPPSRAYLKLWEVFTLAEFYPKNNELAIDLGASPGGWTWVMAKQNCNVFAIDKAKLDKNVQNLAKVDFCKGSGFALEANDCGQIDWLLSDMACYPERLYEYALKWLEINPPKNIIFTLKLQGETDYNLVQKFKKIENSSLIHLSCNKHELTWIFGEINFNLQKA